MNFKIELESLFVLGKWLSPQLFELKQTFSNLFRIEWKGNFDFHFVIMMTGELLNILQPRRVVLIAFKKSFVSFRERHECDIIDEFKKNTMTSILYFFFGSPLLVSNRPIFIIILVSVWYKVYFQTVFILIFFKLDWD